MDAGPLEGVFGLALHGDRDCWNYRRLKVERLVRVSGVGSDVVVGELDFMGALDELLGLKPGASSWTSEESSPVGRAMGLEELEYGVGIGL